MEQPTTVDLASLGIVATGWVLLLGHGFWRGFAERAKERVTAIATEAQRLARYVRNSAVAATSLAARSLGAVARFLLARVFLPTIVTTQDGRQFALAFDELGIVAIELESGS